MSKIKKIMCFCGSGLGTSFLMEMNINTALSNLGITGVEVFHSQLDDVTAGTADLYVCSQDLAPRAEGVGKVIGVMDMMSVPELEEKLKAAFEEAEE